jgi:NADH-quinone oxidoreductase subunit M
MYKRVYFGAVANDHVRRAARHQLPRVPALALLAIAVLYMGLYPKPFTDVMDASVAKLLSTWPCPS